MRERQFLTEGPKGYVSLNEGKPEALKDTLYLMRGEVRGLGTRDWGTTKTLTKTADYSGNR
jgi:hypothetical protein